MLFGSGCVARVIDPSLELIPRLVLVSLDPWNLDISGFAVLILHSFAPVDVALGIAGSGDRIDEVDEQKGVFLGRFVSKPVEMAGSLPRLHRVDGRSFLDRQPVQELGVVDEFAQVDAPIVVTHHHDGVVRSTIVARLESVIGNAPRRCHTPEHDFCRREVACPLRQSVRPILPMPRSPLAYQLVEQLSR